jgi:hypothetical protein
MVQGQNALCGASASDCRGIHLDVVDYGRPAVDAEGKRVDRRPVADVASAISSAHTPVKRRLN